MKTRNMQSPPGAVASALTMAPVSAMMRAPAILHDDRRLAHGGMLNATFFTARENTHSGGDEIRAGSVDLPLASSSSGGSGAGTFKLGATGTNAIGTTSGGAYIFDGGAIRFDTPVIPPSRAMPPVG